MLPSQPQPHSEPINNRDNPDGPWKVCVADYKGPIGGNRGYYFHVLVDTYSKWPEISVAKSTRFVILFPALDKSFETHSYPKKMIHNGGPPYNSRTLQNYAEESGFKTDIFTPKHPDGNGQADKMMSSIVKLTYAVSARLRTPRRKLPNFCSLTGTHHTAPLARLLPFS